MPNQDQKDDESGSGSQSGSIGFVDFLSAKEKRFNTKDILVYFILLLNPEKFKSLDKKTQAKITLAFAAIDDTLAHLSQDIKDPLPLIITAIKSSLGTPTKGSKGLELLTRITSFENNHIPNLTIQEESLKEIWKNLVSQFDTLASQEEIPNLAKIENLKAKIAEFRANKILPYQEQVTNLLIETDKVKTEAAKIGITIAPISEKQPTPTSSAPTTPPPIAPPAA